MRNVIFDVGADSAASNTGIRRIVGMVFAVEGVWIDIEIVRIGRFEF